ESIAVFRRAMEIRPGDFNILHGLGTALLTRGQVDTAADLLKAAVEMQPGSAETRSNLGNALTQLGRFPEAIEECRKAITIRPDLPEAHNNYGNVLRRDGQRSEAIGEYQRALALLPDFPDALRNLAIALREDGQLAAAIAPLQRAAQLLPRDAAAHFRLAEALTEAARFAEADEACRVALALSPNFGDAHNLMGNILLMQGKIAPSIEAYRKAIEADANSAAAHANLGSALLEQGEGDAGLNELLRAVELDPQHAKALNNLGNAYHRTGRVQLGLEAYDRSLALDDNPSTASNRLSVMNYLTLDASELFRQYRQWDQRYGQPLKKFIPRHGNDRSGDRVLRVGYVSPDFRFHSVAFFILPLLVAHDRRRFHITCYPSSPKRDKVTEHIRKLADQWRPLAGISDEQAAEMIVSDKIDILVDLSGHTANNRLPLFARKPAPVQVTYLGYANTTGLSAMDWRLTDAAADPPGAECFYSERLMRLGRTAWCFSPLSGSPRIEKRDEVAVTFGCFNDQLKLNEQTLRNWARLLERVPGSRLIIKNRVTGTESVVRQLRQVVHSCGIPDDRVEILAPEATPAQHLVTYNRLDIALDTFPYHGTTTTCEALWMGVPVVTIAGQAHRSRVGVSLLGSVGLGDLVAADENEFIEIAAGLAADRAYLGELRSTMRKRMQESPLMDGVSFAREVEAAYRRMWKEWVEKA
ncbi:MAG TPA: tetratricopeptide repeat protein, partial [Tepidisphaeraceae bacterium]|nr:tetratricopeptide repeat protein [Tepidisphaeraceae bacterium]